VTGAGAVRACPRPLRLDQRYLAAIMPGLRQTTQERCKRTLQMGST
jgi:hypothetical protein